MHIGQLLMANVNILSPWFPREADNAVFTWEQIQASNSAVLTVTIWHKNTEDIGPGTEITTAWTTSGDFRYFQADGLKELVRFEYTVSDVPATGTTDVSLCDPGSALVITAIGWVICRMLQPTWFDTADV